MALLLILESLSPAERAAYLLRRIFPNYPYEEKIRRFWAKKNGKFMAASSAARRLESWKTSSVRSRSKKSRAFDPNHYSFQRARPGMSRDWWRSWPRTRWFVHRDGGGKVAAALAYNSGGTVTIAQFLLGILKKAPPGSANYGFVRVRSRARRSRCTSRGGHESTHVRRRGRTDCDVLCGA